jgi:hypothetical protein
MNNFNGGEKHMNYYHSSSMTWIYLDWQLILLFTYFLIKIVQYAKKKKSVK